MMQTGWRLERTYLAGAGFPESRLEGLDINWSDPLEPTGHAALWADNGTGKTTITALRYALYLPHSRDFIRGDSDRSLARLVYSGDVCHVVEQATRVIDGELQRIVVGFVADWADGGTRDLDNPSKLQRAFYGFVTGPVGPTIDDLPFRSSIGRWATRAQFIDAVRGMLPDGGALPPHPPSDHQTRWRQWLIAAGIDLEQVRFQTVMNASEGGVDRVMRFADSDHFVRWLIGATTPISTVEQIANSIEVLRTNAAARPRWADELALWQRVVDPLLSLAIAHEEVATNRRAVKTAEAEAATVVADAGATIAALRDERDVAAERHTYHEQRRRDTAALLRRAQAHRLRMQLRAAQLRAEVAKATADGRRDARDDAAGDLAAWQLVTDVVDAKATASRLAGLTERLESAEKETADLQRNEARHRRDLARLITDRRDQADVRLAEAERQETAARLALDDADEDLQAALTAQATAAEKVRHAEERASQSEQVLAEAVSSGLLDEEEEPSALDRGLAEKIADARRARHIAEVALERINEQIGVEQQAKSAAEQRKVTAGAEAAEAERQLRDVNRRVSALAHDVRLVEAAGQTSAELWTSRITLTDSLRQRISAADADAAAAREDVVAARRILESVGSDGLLPASALADEAAHRCQNADVPAWPGWRWLADTMTPQAAVAFATARPEIASGVVVAHPELVDDAVTAIGAVDLDTALWVGAVIDTDLALRPDVDDEGTNARVLLPHPGILDRQAARDMLTTADQKLTDANTRYQTATTRAADMRDMLAALAQLWSDLPDDPRAEFTQRIQTAHNRRADAESAERSAADRLANLVLQRRDRERDRETAQQIIDDGNETRRLLVPVTAAAAELAQVHEQLPALRATVAENRRRAEENQRRRPQLVADTSAATDRVREQIRLRDDAAEALRASGLSATTDGQVPTDDEDAIRARLESIQDAITKSAVDPELHQQIKRARDQLSDIDSRLDADSDRRQRAEHFAATDGARHPVALPDPYALPPTSRDLPARSTHGHRRTPTPR